MDFKFQLTDYLNSKNVYSAECSTAEQQILAIY